MFTVLRALTILNNYDTQLAVHISASEIFSSSQHLEIFYIQEKYTLVGSHVSEQLSSADCNTIRSVIYGKLTRHVTQPRIHQSIATAFTECHVSEAERNPPINLAISLHSKVLRLYRQLRIVVLT